MSSLSNYDSDSGERYIDHEMLRECLGEQLLEIDLLKSIYSGDGELEVCDFILQSVRDFVEGDLDELEQRLEFTINLISSDDIPFQIAVQFPLRYPFVQLEMSIRCDSLSMKQHRMFNPMLKEYITDNFEEGYAAVTCIINWIIDQGFTLCLKENPMSNSGDNHHSNSKPDHLTPSPPEPFVRAWLYSHHIYNKHKRHDVVHIAVTSRLTGFMCPGKPGLICVEGGQSSVDEYIRDVKSMNWQRLVEKHRTVLDDYDTIEECSRFTEFRERPFISGEMHMDRGKLRQFLAENNLDEVFPIIFDIGAKAN